MTVNKRKKRISDGTIKIITCAVLYAALALFISGLFALSANYGKIYNSPAVAEGKADFTGITIEPRDVACNLAGEWEFYYNKWIVTDNADCEPDGLIKLPSTWTYKNFGNGALPKTGYASYRLLIENVQPDIDINVYRYNSDFAYRVFLNGKLNIRSGTLSKNPSETVVTGGYDEKIPFHTDGTPIEIVIELSANNVGGMNAAPWLNYNWSGNTYGSRLRSFTYVALGISVAAVAISILTSLFFRYKRDYTVPLFMSALFVHFLFSKDMLAVMTFPFTAAQLIRFFSALASFVLLIIHLKRNGMQLKKVPVIATSCSATLFSSLLIGFYGTPLSPVFALLLFATGLYYLLPIIFAEKVSAVQRGVYGALFTFMMAVFGIELCDELGLFVFGTEFFFSIVLMFMLVCLTALWLWKTAKAASTAMRVSELEYELSSIKHKALKAQIKPHFVYNSLTAIQSRYRDGLTEGDRAIEQFARHLRLITDSDGEDTIPFDDEVRNVLNYFELENLRAQGKLHMLLDLDFTEFSVPVLSLQPLVENAVRHGDLRSVKDGVVTLASAKNEKFITVTVSDNGRGFDPETTQAGVGLENTRKRFALCGARMRVESSVGGGTKVIIEIPLE